MKFTTQKELLNQATGITSRLASARATLPILQNLYLEVDKKTILIRSTDLEQTLEVTIEGEIDEPGKITVPARLLQDYLQNTLDQQLTVATDETTLLLSSLNNTAQIKGLAAEDYPTLPKVQINHQVTIGGSVLKQAISRTIFATATDETRPILTGLLFRFTGENLTIVGTDGYRLSLVTTPLKGPLTGDFIIPRRALQELIRLLGDEPVELQFGPSQVCFVAGNIRFISRLLDGSFPNYEAIIPKKKTLETVVSAAALLQNLRLASLFSRDSASSVKFQLHDQTLKITATSPRLGESVNIVNLEKPVNEDFTINVNAHYFIEMLAVASSDVSLSFIDAASPVIVRLKGDQDSLYLVMPLRSE